jgi:hypothetical protein
MKQACTHCDAKHGVATSSVRAGAVRADVERLDRRMTTALSCLKKAYTLRAVPVLQKPEHRSSRGGMIRRDLMSAWKLRSLRLPAGWLAESGTAAAASA